VAQSNSGFYFRSILILVNGEKLRSEVGLTSGDVSFIVVRPGDQIVDERSSTVSSEFSVKTFSFKA
jgi:hypothetical protein